jgi:glutathione S-transferase
MKLIGSPTSPYVRKVCIVMAEKKLDYRMVVEDVWSANTTINASNPLGKVPCLVLEGGEAVFDSRVIVEYLDTLSPVGKLIPTNGRERAEVKTWEALADGLMDAAILARLEAGWAHRLPEQRCQAWIDRQLKKIDDSLAAMDRALAERSNCVGIQISLADIAVGVAVGSAGILLVGIVVLGESFGAVHVAAFGLAMAGLLLATWPETVAQ